MRKTAPLLVLWLAVLELHASSEPRRFAHGAVVSQHALASEVGAAVLKEGGNAVDAAVATAFALAVVHPAAGNLGGGGFLIYRPPTGESVAYDFREKAPAKAHPEMFLSGGTYDEKKHHESALAVGVPGSVAGLHRAWKEQGKLPWRRLVEPAVKLARDGFVVSDALARSLAKVLPDMKPFPESVAQFTRAGTPYQAGDRLKQPELARSLERIARDGLAGFYKGETARLLVKQLARLGGIVTLEDLASYRAERRVPVHGTYRGYEVISMPPPSSGGTALVEMLNVLEGYDLQALGFGSADALHLGAEAMRRAFADRARHLGDPEENPALPIARLTSKEYASELRSTIRKERASASSPESFEWPKESSETTHLSVVDKARGAVALTTTLEDSYGVKMVVKGAGFLLNNEMGDFNAGPGLTDTKGLIGTPPNLARPGRRMLSSMTPAILAKDGKLALVTGSPGGRTIINTVLMTVLDTVDFGMNAQEAVDAPRFHHQWLPDQLQVERAGFSPDTLRILEQRGHQITTERVQGIAQVIGVVDGVLEAGADRRDADSGAAGH